MGQEYDLSKLLLDVDEVKTPVCKGRFYRGYVTKYQTKYGIAKKIEVRILKRMSCPGCDKCGGIDEDLNMGLWEDYISLEGIEDGKIYQTEYYNVSTDWEGGYVDSYDIRFVEVKDIAQTN
jgi:hypothetical protein